MIWLSSIFVSGTVLINFLRSLSLYSIIRNSRLIFVQSILSLLLIALVEILLLLISFSALSANPSNETDFFFVGLVEAFDYGVPMEPELIGDSLKFISTELSFYKSSISLLTSVLLKTSSGSMISINFGEKKFSCDCESFLKIIISRST